MLLNFSLSVNVRYRLKQGEFPVGSQSVEKTAIKTNADRFLKSTTPHGCVNTLWEIMQSG